MDEWRVFIHKTHGRSLVTRRELMLSKILDPTQVDAAYSFIFVHQLG